MTQGDSPPDTSLTGEMCQMGQSPCHEVDAVKVVKVISITSLYTLLKAL